jgi:hypothetical protein
MMSHAERSHAAFHHISTQLVRETDRAAAGERCPRPGVCGKTAGSAWSGSLRSPRDVRREHRGHDPREDRPCG